MYKILWKKLVQLIVLLIKKETTNININKLYNIMTNKRMTHCFRSKIFFASNDLSMN